MKKIKLIETTCKDGAILIEAWDFRPFNAPDHDSPHGKGRNRTEAVTAFIHDVNTTHHWEGGKISLDNLDLADIVTRP